MRRRVAVISLLAVLRITGGELSCLEEDNVCYEGANINVDFSNFNSPRIGCKEVQNERECCQLCGEYWPQCLSWQFIKEGTQANGYPNMNNYCCLKGELAPDPVAYNFCKSGYPHHKCWLTSSCAVELVGSYGYLNTGSSIAVLSPNQTCGSAGAMAASWPGITNPESPPTLVEARLAQFDLGVAPSGTAGQYNLCYGSTGDSVEDHSTIVGLFTMRGPSEGQSFFCTFGVRCIVTLAGYDFPVIGDGARYKVVVVEDSGGGSPCGVGATRADFGSRFQNPDNVEDNDFDDTFDMGTPASGSTTSSYALCWANDPDENDVTTFPFLVGSFTLNGPEASDQSCIMGLECSFTLAGTGMSTDMALLFAEGTLDIICENLNDGNIANFGASLNNPIRAASAIGGRGGNATFSFGVPTQAYNNIPGYNYRLCFCGSPTQEPPAVTLNDYAVDVGTFTLHGPIFEQTECDFTTPCDLSIAGSGLDTFPWGMLIIGEGEECGSPGTGVNISGGTWSNPAPANITTGVVSFGFASFGIPSGFYSACWGAYPSTLADYNVRVGTFLMNGPVAMTGSTCVKGVECMIVVQCPEGSAGECGLKPTNRLLLLEPGETCGTANAVEATFSPMSTNKDVQNDGNYKEYQLGFPDVGTAKTGYVMCWAANPSSIVDYSLRLGELAMLGVNTEDMTCTLGLPCVLQLTGLSPESTNRILVLGSGNCGQNENDIRYAELTGLSTRALVDAVDPYDTYTLSTPTAGLPGPNYKVCWGSNPGLAGGTNKYRVEAGVFTINGPVQVPHECDLGLDCVISLTGTGLSVLNKVLIIHATSNCGDDSPTVATFDGVENPKLARASDPSRFDLGLAVSTSNGFGSDYKLCWAHDPSSLADYKVTVGVFSMYGPDPEGLVECTMGVACSITISSHVELEPTNQIMLTANTDSCGQASLDVASFEGFVNPISVSAVNHQFAVGTSTFGVPGDYKICWAHEPGSHSDFNVEVGTFRMNGPKPEPKECALSEPCHVSALGVGLSEFSAVIFISGFDECGQADAEVISWPGIVNPSDTLGAETYYGAGIGSSGLPGVYQICWSSLPLAGGPEAYNVRIGTFTMRGPYQGVFLTCDLGQPCNLAISGLQLDGTNSLQLQSDQLVCGAGSAPAALQGLTNPKYVTDDPTDTLYAMGMVTSGGSYGACRAAVPAGSCIGSHYRVCWSHGVTRVNGELNHLVDIGTFAISGPYGEYAIECFIGQICAFTLYGSQLRTSNRVLVIEKRSVCGDASPGIPKLPGLKNPMVASEADGYSATYRFGRSTGGVVAEYRVCWGGSPRVPRQYNVEIGPLFLREAPEGCKVQDNGLTLSCTAR